MGAILGPFFLSSARRRAPAVCGAILAAYAWGATPASAQTGANLLLVVNSSSPVSEAVAHRYAGRRGVAQDNVCPIRAPLTETIERDVYQAQIEDPIWTCISRVKGEDRILYIVLTKDIPIRISGTFGRAGTVSSVDSELTLLYRRRTGLPVPILGFVPNPYFNPGAAPNQIPPFSHETYDIYLRTLELQSSASVPEPGAWALMLLGFGLVGVAARRRPIIPAS